MCNARRYEVTRLPTQQAFLSFKTTMTAATKWNQDSAASPFCPCVSCQPNNVLPNCSPRKIQPRERLLTKHYTPSVVCLCHSVCGIIRCHLTRGDVGHCHGCNARVIRNNTSKHDTKQHHWRGGDSGSGLFDPHHWGPEAREFDETQ